MVDRHDPEDEHMYKQQFHSITICEKCMYSINSKPPKKVYTTLNVRPPDVPGYGHTLRLKIDTGASGNTLRTFRQMYGSDTDAYKRLKKNNPCFGTINIPCQYKESRWINAKFYVVDVPG